MIAMIEVKVITPAERDELGLYVGTRIPGKPIIARCGDNRIERLDTGEVCVYFGYYTQSQELIRKLFAKALSDAFYRNRSLPKGLPV